MKTLLILELIIVSSLAFHRTNIVDSFNELNIYDPNNIIRTPVASFDLPVWPYNQLY